MQYFVLWHLDVTRWEKRKIGYDIPINCWSSVNQCVNKCLAWYWSILRKYITCLSGCASSVGNRWRWWSLLHMLLSHHIQNNDESVDTKCYSSRLAHARGALSRSAFRFLHLSPHDYPWITWAGRAASFQAPQLGCDRNLLDRHSRVIELNSLGIHTYVCKYVWSMHESFARDGLKVHLNSVTEPKWVWAMSKSC